MITTNRTSVLIALLICSVTYSACSPHQLNSEIHYIRIHQAFISISPILNETTEITHKPSLMTALTESPYPSGDVGVNLNDGNIEDTSEEDVQLIALSINHNDTTMSTILNPSDTTPSVNDTSIMVSHGIYDLGQKILSRILHNNGKQDVKSEVISPLSIAGVGYLLYLGASGRTEQELARLLGLSKGAPPIQKEIHLQFSRLLDETIIDQEVNNDDKEYPEFMENRVHQISVGNAIFMNDYFTIRPQFVDVVENLYKSEVKLMNFRQKGVEAKKYIDSWVNNKTHGKIPTILEAPPNVNTQLIVVSALYFKALWWEELGVQLTMKLPFFPNGEDHKSIEVDTIIFSSELLPYYQSKELNCQIIGFRYQKQLSTMYIVQPLISNRQALKDFQNELTADKLESLIKNMTYIHVTSLTFPKFHLENQADLKLIFHQLGVKSLFTSANLSPITPPQHEKINTNATDSLDYLDAVRRSNRSSSLAISEIRHKVDLVVNERGTEGGAATAAVVDRISGRYMKINTPFLFVIRQDITRLPLFYGTVFEPEQD